MNIDTVSVSFIIDPVSLVYISIYMNEFSMTVSTVISPLPLVTSTIRPNLYTIPVSESSNPLALICCACFEGVKRTVFSLSLRVILLFWYCFSGFFNCEVFAVSLNYINIFYQLTRLVYLIKFTSLRAEYPLQMACNFMIYIKFVLRIWSLS